MAALTRPTEATYTVHERMTVDTSDREDHSFCGIMFPVECKELIPIDRIVITSISVRGRLGPLTLWVSNLPSEDNDNDDEDDNNDEDESSTGNNRRRTKSRKYIIAADQTRWSKIYSKFHPPSFASYDKLDLSHCPIVMKPGEVRGIYVHSTLPGDEAVVYDNYFGYEAFSGPANHDHDFVTIRPGIAHISDAPFGHVPVWGWGSAWRHDRKFVGRLEYGVVFKLWNPRDHLLFGPNFQRTVATLFMCQRRPRSPLSLLPDECIFYILHMCKWDICGDDAKTILKQRQREQRRRRRRCSSTASDNNNNDTTRNQGKRSSDLYAAVAAADNNEEEETILYDGNEAAVAATTTTDYHPGWTYWFVNHDFISVVFTATLVMILLKHIQSSVFHRVLEIIQDN